jgi:signal transduction histidine kinase
MASQSLSRRRSLGQLAPPPVAGALLALFATTVLALVWLGVSYNDLRDLLSYLVVSSVLSALAGYVVYRWGETGRRSIRTKILLAYGIGVLIVIINVFITAQLMFFSGHDLGLLVTLLTFGSVFSIGFGASVAGRMTRAVQQLSDGAQRVSQGDFDARVDVRTNDELADLAHAFNTMVANVNEAEDMRRRAEEARRALVAAVSHDLRTPLTAIQAMLEALSDGLIDDAETVRRYHATMRGQVTHLSRLIDDLFELSQLDAGERPYQFMRTDLTAVVRTATEGLAMSAQTRGVRIEFAGSGPLWASAEPIKLTRVIANLVDNATRHAPRDTAVEVLVERMDGDACIVVRDHGPGIAADDLTRIFERFYRGEKSRSRSHGGAGLGLAIARGIVEAHGGRIWAENREGGGAAFYLTIPLER